MEGYIAIHRKILDWEWYNNPNVKIMFLHCLLKANFADKKWQGETIRRGEFVTSIATLAGELGMTVQQVRTALDKLKSTNEITSRTTNKFTIVTISNYDTYQVRESDKQQAEQQAEQQTNNKQITNEQQTNNNNVIIYNNNNNDNKEINIPPINNPPRGKFVKPSLDQVKDFVAHNGYNIDAEQFYDYYESNDWKVGKNKMKSWQAAVRNWVRNENKYNNNGIHQSGQREDSRRETPAPDRHTISAADMLF